MVQRSSGRVRGRVSLAPPSSSTTTASSRDERTALEDEEAVRLREEDDAMNEVIMAVDVKDKGTVGCCYYIARQERLFLMEDARLGGVEVVNTRA